MGQAKNTYGTGNFMLINTGEDLVRTENGLLTTVAYKIGDNKPIYALEGSIAVTGSLVQWVRDNLGLIKDAPEIEDLAKEVDDNGGLFIVPAFSGLFAPHWRSDARGAMVGMTRFHTKNHIARATLEATAFQSREVLDAMVADAESEGVELSELKVDGGMVMNETLMQFQADILGVPVVRPKVIETTALGAAYAAGIAVGFWDGEQDVIDNWAEDKRWEPAMDDETRDRYAAPVEEGRRAHPGLGRRGHRGSVQLIDELRMCSGRRGTSRPRSVCGRRSADAVQLIDELRTCSGRRGTSRPRSVCGGDQRCSAADPRRAQPCARELPVRGRVRRAPSVCPDRPGDPSVAPPGMRVCLVRWVTLRRIWWQDPVHSAVTSRIVDAQVSMRP